MRYLELYLIASPEEILDSIKKKSREMEMELKYALKENHIRIVSPDKGIMKESLKILLWKGGKRYPPNYPLLDIVLFKINERVTEILFRINEVFPQVAREFYDHLVRNFRLYDKWVEFKRLSTP